MTTTRSAARLRIYARDYALRTWGMTIGRIPSADVHVMEIRADGYSNAHVEGEHESNGLCSFTSARECGEQGAAAEYVETTDFKKAAEPTPTNRGDRAAMTHRGHDHPNTKAARAACRRAIYALRNELKG